SCEKELWSLIGWPASCFNHCVCSLFFFVASGYLILFVVPASFIHSHPFRRLCTFLHTT
ncbi:unnamed protein product, partial [Ixodes pacificus]